jgi:hypothetical protein
MTLSAEQWEILKLYLLSIHEPQRIPVPGIMAIKTPSPGFSMPLYAYLLMERESSFSGVGFHARMASGAGK